MNVSGFTRIILAGGLFVASALAPASIESQRLNPKSRRW